MVLSLLHTICTSKYDVKYKHLLSENHHECSNFFMISTSFKHNVPNYNDISTFIYKRNRNDTCYQISTLSQISMTSGY